MLHVQSFLLLISSAFNISRSRSCRRRGRSTSQNHFQYASISLKNRRFDEKRATKTTSVGTQREAQRSPFKDP